MSHDDTVVIHVRQAEVGRLFDRLVVMLVLLAVLAAWLAQPGHPLAFAAVMGLLALSWCVPRFLNARQRAAGACQPGSLCAQTKVDYLSPEAIRLGQGGSVDVRWPGETAFSQVTDLRVLHVGPLVQIALSSCSGVARTRSDQPPGQASRPSAEPLLHGQPAAATPSPIPLAASTAQPGSLPISSSSPEFPTLEITPSVPITDRDADSSTDSAAQPLMSRSFGSSPSGAISQRGSCLLWINRLPPVEAAALRRWLLWRRRGGD